MDPTETDMGGMFPPELATPEQRRAAMVAALRGQQAQPIPPPSANSPDLLFAMGQNSVTQPLAREALQSAHFQSLGDFRNQNLGLGTQRLAQTAEHLGNVDTNRATSIADREWQRIPLNDGSVIEYNIRTQEQRKVSGPVKKQFAPHVPGGVGGGALTPEAIEVLVDQMHDTGKAPTPRSVGASYPLVMQRYAEKYSKDRLAGQAGDYGADTGSLKHLQQQVDAVDAFEQTANKNLDTALAAATKIIDRGSPFFNAGARAISQRLMGSPEQAAFTAALMTARTEIAKVLSGAMGNGGLSDSARQEVEHLLSSDASLAQLEAAAKILRQDMANRKAAMSGQLNEIRGRIRGQRAPVGEPAQPPGAAPQPTAPAAGLPAGMMWLKSKGDGGKMRVPSADGKTPAPGYKPEPNPNYVPPTVATNG